MELTKQASDLLILCKKEMERRDPLIKNQAIDWVKTESGLEYFTDTDLLRRLTLVLDDFCSSFENHPDPAPDNPAGIS